MNTLCSGENELFYIYADVLGNDMYWVNTNFFLKMIINNAILLVQSRRQWDQFCFQVADHLIAKFFTSELSIQSRFLYFDEWKWIYLSIHNNRVNVIILHLIQSTRNQEIASQDVLLFNWRMPFWKELVWLSHTVYVT